MMDKTIVGFIGAATALVSLGGAAQAAPRLQDVMTATSYDDLLQPIPNAAALLQTSNALLAEQAVSESEARVEQAQYYYHHHHHHRFYRPYYHHHHRYHHHHHHHRYYNNY